MEKREEFLNHRLHRLRMALALGRVALRAKERLVLCHVLGEEFLTELVILARYAAQLPRARTPTHFLICVICEICGLKILLFSPSLLVRRLTGQDIISFNLHKLDQVIEWIACKKTGTQRQSPRLDNGRTRIDQRLALAVKIVDLETKMMPGIGRHRFGVRYTMQL